MKREVVGAQGEITIFRVSAMPEGLTPYTEKEIGRAHV